MDKNPFLKRLVKDTKSEVVHSSAYAKAQNAGGIGVASTQSFTARREIDSNRTTVKGYKDSRIVNDALGNRGTKLQEYDAKHDASQRAAIRDRFGGERNNGISEKQGGYGFGGGINNRESDGGKLTSPSGRSTTPPAWRNTGISR